ncbi:MAG: molybdopterin-dependent oxidoreductase [Aquificota bacterium]|nr:molybdopterin-dependent oxidoreductase [Aquificota bacterium]
MITRREFLQLSGLSLAVVLTPQGYSLLKAKEVEPPYSPEIWLNLSEDNFLTVLVNKSEMGQGVYTGLPQIVAEELDFPQGQGQNLCLHPAGRRYVDPKWGVQLTGGGTSVRNMYEFLRYVGASMKEMLIRAAAKGWGVRH